MGEVAKVFGVPFEIIPFKATGNGPVEPPADRKHVCAVPEKAQYRIRFPRVEGYTQAIRNHVAVNWEEVPRLVLDPLNIPPEVEVKGGLHASNGRPSLTGPGRLESVTLNPYRAERRLQELEFDLATSLTRTYAQSGRCDIPSHVLFPQILSIVRHFMDKKLVALPPTQKVDVFCSPYYGWVIERLAQAIQGDTSKGETPEVPRYEANRKAGSTDEVSFWTSRDVREVVKSHLNYVVADTKQWEQSAAYFIDAHPAVEAFVKNAGLGFAIPYLHNGEPHDYVPDFIVRMNGGKHLIVETKGFDPLEDVKTAAALRWVAAVNADGRHGVWEYHVCRRPEEVRGVLDQAG